ncbi:hypothetical protein Leryth_023996 [Lithospermum erythrorhizon]|nr:hypothetical protein Leryth_023996 [Lithospermum erythrorhizon]
MHRFLSEMDIPDDYTESLQKNGRSTLGDLFYKSITVDFFDPDQFLGTMDLTSEHKVLDLKNKIEASMVIWRRKLIKTDAWGRGSSLKTAETIPTHLAKFPGLPQFSLDISKIEHNKDVGFSVLEIYSRVLESLANTVMNRVEMAIMRPRFS